VILQLCDDLIAAIASPTVPKQHGAAYSTMAQYGAQHGAVWSTAWSSMEHSIE
jgi:hypothetical protein